MALTVLYDTISARRGVKDDVQAGVKSIVAKHQAQKKTLMIALSEVQVGLPAGAGVVCGCGPVFYAVSCAGPAGTLAYKVRKVGLGDFKECWCWYKWCARHEVFRE
jgi:4-hydroxybenzoate polyprenyltransferase